MHSSGVGFVCCRSSLLCPTAFPQASGSSGYVKAPPQRTCQWMEALKEPPRPLHDGGSSRCRHSVRLNKSAQLRRALDDSAPVGELQHVIPPEAPTTSTSSTCDTTERRFEGLLTWLGNDSQTCCPLFVPATVRAAWTPSVLHYTMAADPLAESGVTMHSDSEQYSAGEEASTSPESTSSSTPMILYQPPTLWGLIRGTAINLLLPFVNGMMLGFGELFAHEAAFRLGWGGTKVCSPVIIAPWPYLRRIRINELVANLNV